MEERDILEINDIVQKEHDKKLNRLELKSGILATLGAVGILILKIPVNKMIEGTTAESYSAVITISLLFLIGITWIYVIFKESNKLIKKREKIRARLIFNKLGGK